MGAETRRRDAPVYDSARRRWPPLDELVSLCQYRALVVHLIGRNIKIRYKRSVLGLAWTLLNPLLMLVVLAVAFSSLFSASVPNYVTYVLAGIVLWTFFSQTTVSIAASLTWSGSLFHRVYLPRAAFPMAALGSGLVNILLSMAPLLVVAAALGVTINQSTLFVPVSILFAAMFAFGIGLVVSAVALDLPDVREMYEVLLTLWIYLTPVFYPVEIVPEQSRWLFNLNPMHHLLAAFREPIQLGRLPPTETIVAAGSIATVTLLGGWWLFANRADEIPYRV
jgi:ABC-type polysaccharide/polyol phosphate export permease